MYFVGTYAAIQILRVFRIALRARRARRAPPPHAPATYTPRPLNFLFFAGFYRPPINPIGRGVSAADGGPLVRAGFPGAGAHGQVLQRLQQRRALVRGAQLRHVTVRVPCAPLV